MSNQSVDPLIPGSLTVDEIRPECRDVIRIVLIDPNGAELPTWEPGSHIDVTMPNGVTRQYSLCGDPRDRTRYEIAVLREPESRGGSLFLHDSLAKGDVLTVGGPRNHFRLRPAGSYLFVAGGIGITPLLPMLAEARSRGIPYHLVYAGRSRSAMAFLEELTGDDRVDLRISDEGTRLDVSELLVGRDDVDVYACGPARLLDELQQQCLRFDREQQFHCERFSNDELDSDASKNSRFEVELAQSGIVAEVGPDESVLDVLTAHGIEIMTSCEEGVCGSCETVVLSGEVDHRDQVLDEDERAANELMMVCCSRARSGRLVLDL